MWSWLKNQKLFLWSAACFIIIGLLWFKEELDAAASRLSGEEDLGVGILFVLAMMTTVFLAPAGLAFLGLGIAKLRHERRLKRTSSGY